MPSAASRRSRSGTGTPIIMSIWPASKAATWADGSGMTWYDHAINFGPAAVIVVPGFEDVAIVLAEFDQCERTGADGVAVELFLADFFEVGGRDQLTAVVADVPFER